MIYDLWFKTFYVTARKERTKIMEVFCVKMFGPWVVTHKDSPKAFMCMCWRESAFKSDAAVIVGISVFFACEHVVNYCSAAVCFSQPLCINRLTFCFHVISLSDGWAARNSNLSSLCLCHWCNHKVAREHRVHHDFINRPAPVCGCDGLPGIRNGTAWVNLIQFKRR